MGWTVLWLKRIRRVQGKKRCETSQRKKKVQKEN